MKTGTKKPRLSKTFNKKKKRRKGFSRSKGKRGERIVVTLMRRWFPDSKRGIQSRDGSDAPDITDTPFWIEVKYYDLVTPKVFADAYNQAVHAMERGLLGSDEVKNFMPIVVLCKSTHPSMRSIGWEVLTSYTTLNDLGYTGANHKFQHPYLVNKKTDLRLVPWDKFRELMDNYYPVQTPRLSDSRLGSAIGKKKEEDSDGDTQPNHPARQTRERPRTKRHAER